MSFSFILLTSGIVGGAEHRFIRLFMFLDEKYKGQIFFFVTHSLKKRIQELYPDICNDRIISIGNVENSMPSKLSEPQSQSNNKFLLFIKKQVKRTYSYRLYYYLRSKRLQYKRYKEIDQKRKQLGIACFIGVYSGILPLYFYYKKNKSRPGIIFSNMDSWLSNISVNPRKEWYRKYVSFNYALENSDLVDFLSPFIYEGVRKLGIKIQVEKVNITPCSFTDYSKCHIGAKNKFRIAFSGRLENDKNPVMFIDAAQVLAKEHPEVEFHVMGEGRLSETIPELVINSGLSNIIFHGFHNNPPEVLAETSLFVSIQTTNNYPSQSVLEAMACGNAIIASDVGDTRLFINELNGTLIPLELNAITNAIREYIKNPQSAIKKGLYAADYVRKEFTIEKVADYYLGLFEKAAHRVKSN